MSISGRQVTDASGSSTFRVDGASDRYDPSVPSGSSQLYALRRGLPGLRPGRPPDAGRRPVRHDGTGDRPLRRQPPRRPGRRDDPGRPAGRTGARAAPARRRCSPAPVCCARPGTSPGGSGRCRTRARGGAVVLYITHGRTHEVHVPGITGEDVRRFLVSRDALATGGRPPRPVPRPARGQPPALRPDRGRTCPAPEREPSAGRPVPAPASATSAGGPRPPRSPCSTSSTVPRPRSECSTSTARRPPVETPPIIVRGQAFSLVTSPVNRADPVRRPARSAVRPRPGRHEQPAADLGSAPPHLRGLIHSRGRAASTAPRRLWSARGVLDAFRDLVLGGRCVGCDRAGRLLCDVCAGDLEVAPAPRVADPCPGRAGRALGRDGVRRGGARDDRRPQGASSARAGPPLGRPARGDGPRGAAGPVGRPGPGAAGAGARRVRAASAQRGYEPTTALTRAAAARLGASACPPPVLRCSCDPARPGRPGRARRRGARRQPRRRPPRPSSCRTPSGRADAAPAWSARPTSWSATTCSPPARPRPRRSVPSRAVGTAAAGGGRGGRDPTAHRRTPGGVTPSQAPGSGGKVPR